jgi:hypothetical protein
VNSLTSLRVILLIPPEELPLSVAYRAPQKAVKVKIEFSDNSGTKYSFNIEGNSRENISKLLDFANSISVKETDAPESQEPIDTNFGRVYTLIQDRFRLGSFTSSDILEAYREEFHAATSLSVVSTYLSRLSRRGLLKRSRHGAGWMYTLPKMQVAPQQVAASTPNDLVP